MPRVRSPMRSAVLPLRSFAIACACAVALAVVPALAARGAKVDREREKKPPVVAVFAFKVLNKEEKLAHLGEGAADAIVNKIVNDKSLRIVEESQLDKAVNAIARNQSGLFEEESYLAVGRMVDARFIVIGSVQVVSDQVAVNARLLEVETRQLLASSRSAKPMAAIFDAYEEVAAQLLSKMTFHLSQRITAGESADEIAVRQLIEDAKIYDPQFPAGRDPKGGEVPKDLARALALYNKAVLRDPKSAVAQLALGDAEGRMSTQLAAVDQNRARELLASAREHLRRSTEIDANNPWAWTHLGRAEGRLANHAQARLAFERALAVDAGHVAARYGLAVALYNAGEHEAARQHAQQARDGGDARAHDLLKSIETAVAAQKQKPNPTR
jgi:TolB-like protein